MRHFPHRQHGYMAIALVIAVSIIAFSFIAAYSGLLAKKEAAALLDTQKAYMARAGKALQTVYLANAALIDGDASQGAYRNPQVFLDLAGIQPKWGLQAAVSDRLSANGLAYTVVALWLPTDTDSLNPPAFDKTTGQFTSCSHPGQPCSKRAYLVFSGLETQQKLYKAATDQLNDVATKEQSFFKAHWLMDPDHNISTNYFRAPSGDCSNTNEMPCLDTYTELSTTWVPTLLGIDTSEGLINPWGLPIEASNQDDSSSTSPPYSMSFRSATPWGTYIEILAIQPV